MCVFLDSRKKSKKNVYESENMIATALSKQERDIAQEWLPHCPLHGSGFQLASNGIHLRPLRQQISACEHERSREQDLTQQVQCDC